jgi:hypothetical protein
VIRAALAQLPNGKRHPHQRRVPRESLEESRRRLIQNLPSLKRVPTFDELFQLIDTLIRPISKVGELTVYDTSLRIGARLGLEPAKVYLHAGTRQGARALGLSDRPRREALEMAELPAPLQRLTAREVEDLLCIYKGRMRGAPAFGKEPSSEQPVARKPGTRPPHR